MFKMLLSLAVLFLGSTSFAAVQPIISPNNDRALLIFQDGRDTYQDAYRLYQLLRVEARREGAAFKKSIATADGKFSLVCSLSEAANFASCTVIVLAGQNTVIDRATRIVEYRATDEVAKALHDYFAETDDLGFRYESGNSLKMAVFGSDVHQFLFAYTERLQ